MSNNINFVYITDDNYVDLTLMSICSLFENKDKESKYNVSVLCIFDKKESVNKFDNQIYSYDIKLIDATKYLSSYKNVFPQHRHVSSAALLKFFLPSIFPDYEKILYIDGDTIIQKDLSDLYNTAIEDKYAAVVKDTIFFANPKHMRVAKIKNEFYFNSGVLLFNLSKFREDDITNKLIEYKRNNDTNFMDQDAFNAVLGHNVIYVSWKYNFLPFYTKRLNPISLSCVYDYDFRDKKIEDIVNEAIILHLGGPDKPWKYNKGSLSKICFKYMQMSGLSVPTLSQLPKYDLSTIPHSPAVSILMPSLNTAKYIGEALESALNQTLKDIEIICIDAGSTDGTVDIINAYAQKDLRIKLVKSDIKSYGHQLNLGLSVAKGEFVAILETDDYLALNMCEEQVKLARDKNLDFVKANYNIFYGLPDERIFKYINVDSKFKYYDRVINPKEEMDVFNTNLVIWTGIYRKEFLDKNDIRFNESSGASYQDNGFYFKTYSLAERIWFTQNDYYRLRRDNPNSSVKSKAKVYAMCGEYAHIKDFVLKLFPDNKDIYRMFLKKKKQNYFWNLTRIAEEYKQEFLEKFAEEFKVDLENGDICTPYFYEDEISTVKKIVADSKAYYKDYTRVRIENLSKKLQNSFIDESCKTLNLKEPKTYNEKVQWLKLYDSNDLKSDFADIYTVRRFIKEKLNEKFLLNLLGVYKNVDEIDFSSLPESFIVWCSHGSNYHYVVDNKSQIDLEKLRLRISGWMSEDNALSFPYELYYKNVEPRILVTEYVPNDEEYRLWCFNGSVKLIEIRQGDSSVIYNISWKKLICNYAESKGQIDITKPENLEDLIDFGSRLGGYFPHCIVVCSNLNNEIKFKRVLFSANVGLTRFNKEKYDIDFGKLIFLPSKAYNVFSKLYFETNKLKKCGKAKLNNSSVKPNNIRKNRLKNKLLSDTYRFCRDSQNLTLRMIAPFVNKNSLLKRIVIKRVLRKLGD